MIAPTQNTLWKALAVLLIWSSQSVVFADPPLPGSLTHEQYLEQVSKQRGWAGERLARIESADAPRFKLKGDARDNANRRVVLWDYVLWARGEHLPTRRQEIGDCVGFGAAQAVDYLQYVRIVLLGKRETFKPVFVPFHYACGRMAPDCGDGNIRGPDGSVGSWQAKALQRYGVIQADLPGLPEYSASVARQWAVRMPDQRWLDEGEKHLVKHIALVETPEQLRDAICNGYPCTNASDWGGLMKPPVVDGKLVNRRATTWPHQTCFIGYDGTGSEPLWYWLNSWGPNAHGTPPDDSPPGGFWLRRRDVAYILSQSDSFALSDLDTGFESRDLDLSGLAQRMRENPDGILAQSTAVDRARATFVLGCAFPVPGRGRCTGLCDDDVLPLSLPRPGARPFRPESGSLPEHLVPGWSLSP